MALIRYLRRWKGSSEDTEACSYRAGSDMGDVGMQLDSSSAEGGGSPCDRDGMDGNGGTAEDI